MKANQLVFTVPSDPRKWPRHATWPRPGADVRPAREHGGLLAAAACSAAVVLGIAIAVSPWLPLVAFTVAGAAWLGTKPVGRLALFAAGTMVVFQSTAIGAGARIALLAVVMIGAGTSLQSISTTSAARTSKFQASRLGLPVIGLMTAVLLTVPLIPITGVSPMEWAKDATTYVLIVAGPIFGLDAGLHGLRRQIQMVTVVVSSVAAFSFLVTWLDRRGYGLAGLDQFALSSSMLVIPGMAMCLTLYLRREATHAVWLLVGLAQAGMLIMTGGRSAVIYTGAVIVASVLGARGAGRRGVRRRLTVLLASGLALLATFAISSRVVDAQFLTRRFDWFYDPSFANIENDLSGQARLRAYSILADSWSSAPLFGKGLGYSYPAVATGTSTTGSFTLDSPLILLAKFGIIGTIILLTSLAALLVALLRNPTSDVSGRELARGLCLGLVAAWFAMLPGGSPTESKGFGVALALVVALSVTWSRSPEGVGRVHNRTGSESRRRTPCSTTTRYGTHGRP